MQGAGSSDQKGISMGEQGVYHMFRSLELAHKVQVLRLTALALSLMIALPLILLLEPPPVLVSAPWSSVIGQINNEQGSLKGQRHIVSFSVRYTAPTGRRAVARVYARKADYAALSLGKKSQVVIEVEPYQGSYLIREVRTLTGDLVSDVQLHRHVTGHNRVHGIVLILYSLGLAVLCLVAAQILRMSGTVKNQATHSDP